ncbi:MAG: GNAT family N-acetyltransferase [Bryobacteraceae bacterium]|jgi:ribosomal protein S18 acetylase RimI-like enzyme
MTPRIRRGRADDAEFLASVMFSASRAHLARGLWDLIIGADEAGCLDYLRRLALAEPRSLYHYESFLIAEIAGEPAAALCGFETGSKHTAAWEIVGDAMSNVQRDLGWTEVNAAASYQRVGPVWAACMPPDIGADFAIESVATLPQYRRRGIISGLIDEVLLQARQRGCNLAQITTYIGNNAAQSAYEKSGFRVLDEKRCNEVEKILGVPGFVRLAREIEID